METGEFIRKYKNLIFNLGLVILALFISHNIYKGALRQIELLKEKKQAEIQKNIILGEIRQEEEKLVSYKDIFSAKDADRIIDNLNSLAKESSVKIISIRPDTEVSLPDYTKSPFTLMLNVADYHVLGKFISNLENASNVYMVESSAVRLMPQGKGLEVDLKISSIAYTD